MNSRYFACKTCKTLIDAGYRWAYWTLEHPGIVTKGHPIIVANILQCHAYWEPSEPSPRLTSEIFPQARAFLALHAVHELAYGEAEDFMSFDDDDLTFLEWLELGPAALVTPRGLRVLLGLASWAEVESWVAANPEHTPYWWDEETTRVVARKLFERACAD